MTKNRAKKAVSEVIGTAILLGMSLALFSVVQIIAFSFPFTPATPSVQLIGSIDYDNTLHKNIVLITHHGGESLSLKTKILFKIGSDSYSITVDDPSYLDNAAKSNGVWNIGETLVYPDYDVKGKQVDITVVDVNSNSVVMMTTLQG